MLFMQNVILSFNRFRRVKKSLNILQLIFMKNADRKSTVYRLIMSRVSGETLTLISNVR